jgi:hypothetical protein
MRPVVSVHVKDLLVIVAQTSDGRSQSVQLAPIVNGKDEDRRLTTVRATKMRVKVSGSVM